jgi:hypothetical protein
MIVVGAAVAGKVVEVASKFVAELVGREKITPRQSKIAALAHYTAMLT